MVLVLKSVVNLVARWLKCPNSFQSVSSDVIPFPILEYLPHSSLSLRPGHAALYIRLRFKSRGIQTQQSRKALRYSSGVNKISFYVSLKYATKTLSRKWHTKSRLRKLLQIKICWKGLVKMYGTVQPMMLNITNIVFSRISRTVIPPNGLHRRTTSESGLQKGPLR